MVSTDRERIVTLNKERAQRIRNIVVTHVQRYHNINIKPNTTKKERKRLKELRAQDDLIKIPADKGTATVFENESNYVTKEQDQINAMDVQRCYKSEKAII